MQNIFADVRYSFRQFRHAPVFTAAAVLTLALGIGGTTAIFSLVDSVMLRSLPVADPASLYRVGDGTDCCVEGGPQDRWGMFSYPLYQRLKENLPEFDEITAFQAGPNRMSVRRESERAGKPLRTEFVTGSYFETLGIRSFGEDCSRRRMTRRPLRRSQFSAIRPGRAGMAAIHRWSDRLLSSKTTTLP